MSSCIDSYTDYKEITFYGKVKYSGGIFILFFSISIIWLCFARHIYLSSSQNDSTLGWDWGNILFYFPLSVILCVYYFVSFILRFPRISLGKKGIQCQNLFFKSWFKWESLAKFEIVTKDVRNSEPLFEGVSKIIGNDISFSLLKQDFIVIKNIYDVDVHNIVQKANDLRNVTMRNKE